MTYRYIYKITCTAGRFKDKFYYGKHTTINLDDGYKGSGVLLVKYYKKYPNDYIKEIISFHNSDDELNKAEIDIISNYLTNENCLNLAKGGIGGQLKGIHLGQKPWNTGKTLSDEHKHKIGIKSKGHITSEHQKKLMSVHHSGNGNPMYGIEPWNKGVKGKFIWVSNGINTKQINIDELNTYITNGYHRGRK